MSAGVCLGLQGVIGVWSLLRSVGVSLCLLVSSEVCWGCLGLLGTAGESRG